MPIKEGAAISTQWLSKNLIRNKIKLPLLDFFFLILCATLSGANEYSAPCSILPLFASLWNISSEVKRRHGIERSDIENVFEVLLTVYLREFRLEIEIFIFLWRNWNLIVKLNFQIAGFPKVIVKILKLHKKMCYCLLNHMWLSESYRVNREFVNDLESTMLLVKK